jgi:membrane-associated phospholipid phosphatase
MATSRPSAPASAPARARRALAAAALLLSAAGARAEVNPLAIDLRRDLPITIGAAVGDLVLSTSLIGPAHCKWCDTNRFDSWTRDQLRWSNPNAAGTASDVLAIGVLPAAVFANSFFSARAGGAPDAFWEDALVIVEATAVAGLLDGVVKVTAARRRPNAGLQATGDANRSFYSGHATEAFALAASAGTVSTLRGYPSAPWVWAGGMTLAAGVGYLRVAADQHWATDVLAGAAVSGLVGWAVPWVFHRVNHPGAHVAVLPAPGGFAVVY